MNRLLAGNLLEPADRHVDVSGVDLHHASASAGLLRGDHRGAAPAETVEHDRVALGAIENRVGDHGDRLYRRMHREIVKPTLVKLVHAWVLPDVGPVAAKTAELDIVDVRRASILEDEDQLMPRPIERTHAPVAFGPDTQGLQLCVCAVTGGVQFEKMPPIHANEMD